ncbi:addiction module protein [Litoribacillus peritrichatus]|uniref:Addiction module protein n=1 Tax=Litoribacillus peritrichatus TaxID=718191 RepID=A0ABP7MBP1_9GAMM
MRADELKREINKLTVADRLMLIEDVWDDIAKSNSEIPLPEWQKKELDKRLALYEAGEVKTTPLTDVHEALRNKYK